MDTPTVQPGTTRIDFVMSTIRGRIAGRSLTPGARLPSVRALAASLRVSVSTVVEAYARLVAEGAIASRPGSGFFVAAQLAPMTLSPTGAPADRGIDPLWISRQALEADDDDCKPGCGWLPSSWLPQDSLRKALRSVSRAPVNDIAQYGPPLGLLPMRQLIGRRLGERGVEATPQQIMLTESGTQAIDLICRLLLEPGDTVMLDDPCYFNFQALLRAHRIRVVSVPMTPTGPDVAAFAAVAERERPRLYITNSGVHNPTGAMLSAATALRILRIVDQHGMVVVEDDIFADFEHVPAPRLAGFDGLNRVLQIGSFSKTLSASVRCGFIAARADWIDGLVDLKIATTFGAARLNEAVVHLALSDGTYRRHVQSVRDRLERQRHDVAEKLQAMGIEPWMETRAGMFLWSRLPQGADSSEWARAALRRGLVLAPGNAFSVTQTAGNYMRFNVAQMDGGSFSLIESLLT
ncbi:aminotransferase-like domain-containing protein [Devosia sediminis]|uniref:PLP-dependent aminotransferase family protein n=1 Tax=Devosia sediminis TaxID=2798801 RepID=A0A934MIQ6_9HYPH|nr:PLP-dependent aminotransferase family protein [Devosia sediminis]MBJ3786467.1 PLP-dependent aminotransferase family protein [Devosia sediminis]